MQILKFWKGGHLQTRPLMTLLHFIKTSVEMDGEYTLLEIDLGKSGTEKWLLDRYCK